MDKERQDQVAAPAAELVLPGVGDPFEHRVHGFEMARIVGKKHAQSPPIKIEVGQIPLWYLTSPPRR